MMPQEAFEVWAPPDAPWSPWAKPVLFAYINPEFPVHNVELSRIADDSCVPLSIRDTALVLDLPGAMGVGAAVQLMRKGYRPVPLYNALASATRTLGVGISTVCDVAPIVRAIAAVAEDREAFEALPLEAAPMFLLDAHRRFGTVGPAPGVFDNRSISLPTDFPSATRMLTAGIRRVLLVQQRGSTPQADLSHTLVGWQDGGIAIEAVDLSQGCKVRSIRARVPTFYEKGWQLLVAMIGLRRVPFGGFRGELPNSSSG